jgi:anaerobic ribonucleoside-triphosphate reductase activating protein
MEQAEGLLELLRAVRTQTGLSVLVFSGYTLKQIQLLPLGQDVLGCVDVLIDGAFDESRPVRRGLLGSAHEHVRLLTDRYTEEDMSRVPGAEVVIAPDGSVTVTGISPPSLAR